MQHHRLLILGGSGFIGRHLIARLATQARPPRIIVPTRRPARARALLTIPGVELVAADIHEDATLARLIADSDAVINLVGVLHSASASPYGQQFARVHVALPRRIAAACAQAKVSRVLHVSALGVTDDARPLASQYLRSKADGERALREADGLSLTVFRPSVVFGSDDRFLNLFAALQRVIPVMALGRADARLQPVYVGDVAQAIASAIDQPGTIGKAYELTGPQVFSLRELVRIAGAASGHPRPVIGLPDSLGWLQAAILEFAPGPTLMSRDNFASLAVDNVATPGVTPGLAQLGIEATALGAVLPRWLGSEIDPYSAFRRRAPLA
jgi:uncharacterized protein YbjT (DUF2867 family)